MTKSEFLDILRKELASSHVQDVDDIVNDYVEHFSYKMEEGYTEEEIARNLGDPVSLAKEYIKLPEKANSSKASAIACVSFASFGFSLLYTLAILSVLALGLSSLACCVLGFCLITTVNIAGIIPSIPYFPALLIGLDFLVLSVIFAVGTIYTFFYVKHWGKLFCEWSKKTVRQEKFVSTSLHPKFSKKLASRLKLTLIISLIIFIIIFIVAYITMCAMTNSFEPWHVWHWFD